jgi:hypothetical protein
MAVPYLLSLVWGQRHKILRIRLTQNGITPLVRFGGISSKPSFSAAARSYGKTVTDILSDPVVKPFMSQLCSFCSTLPSVGAAVRAFGGRQPPQRPPHSQTLCLKFSISQFNAPKMNDR